MTRGATHFVDAGLEEALRRPLIVEPPRTFSRLSFRCQAVETLVATTQHLGFANPSSSPGHLQTLWIFSPEFLPKADSWRCWKNVRMLSSNSWYCCKAPMQRWSEPWGKEADVGFYYIFRLWFMMGWCISGRYSLILCYYKDIQTITNVWFGRVVCISSFHPPARSSAPHGHCYWIQRGSDWGPAASSTVAYDTRSSTTSVANVLWQRWGACQCDFFSTMPWGLMAMNFLFPPAIAGWG